MNEDSTRKVAIVTGASSGIGEATTYGLAEAGFDVALLARSEEKIDHMAHDLEGRGRGAIAIRTDVTRRDQVKAAVAATLRRFGRLDLLVNNAGIMPLSFMKNLHEDEWERMIDVNIKGVLNGIGAVLPGMIEQRSGHIINVSSVAGMQLFPSAAVYCATKFAVEAITEGLRLELTRECNIRTTSVRPGAVATNLISTITDPEVFEMFESSPSFEAIQPVDIANAIVYAATRPENVSVTEIVVRPTSQVS